MQKSSEDHQKFLDALEKTKEQKEVETYLHGCQNETVFPYIAEFLKDKWIKNRDTLGIKIFFLFSCWTSLLYLWCCPFPDKKDNKKKAEICV